MMNRTKKKLQRDTDTKTVTKYSGKKSFIMYAPWFKYDSGLDTSFIYLCIQWYYLWAILSFSGWIAFHPFGMKGNLMCIHSFSFADFNRRTTVRSHFHFVYMHKMFNILCSVWMLNDESTALDNVRLPMTFSNIFSTFQSQKRFYIWKKKWVIFIFHIFCAPMVDCQMDANMQWVEKHIRRRVGLNAYMHK